jgi:hypothetical protein
MIIDETPLLGRVAVETGVWNGSSFVWTDQTTKILTASYQEGGRLGTPGASMVDTGTLAVVYRDMATVPSIGSLIRIRRAGTTEYGFTGYIQDVASKVTYDFSVSTNPITFTTLYCLDWVGLASQFQLLGIGGKTSSGANFSESVVYGGRTYTSDGYHRLENRVYAMNRFIDPTGATEFITNPGLSDGLLGDTDLIGTLSDHLDLAAISTGAIWAATHNLPTNPTTGRDNLIEIRNLTSLNNSGITFTDGAGLAGELHYTEIDLDSSSQNIANSIVIKNNVRYNIRDTEIVVAGGADSQNFIEIDGQQRAGIMIETPWKEVDATSVATYGLRQAEIDTCIAVATAAAVSTENNLVSNPSAEYNADGYTTGAQSRLRRAKPSEDPNPFSLPNGLGVWAMRSITRTADPTPVIRFDGTSSDAIPVVAGTDYNLQAYAYRGIPNRTDVRARARISWYDSNEDLISNVYGAQTSIPGATWVRVSSGQQRAPSGAVRCFVALEFNRSGGGNFSVGDRLWADGFNLFAIGPTAIAFPPYFDGDTPNSSSHLHFWTGSPGASPSYRETNSIDTRALAILDQYSSTSNRVTRIRWNAQEDLTKIHLLRVGSRLTVKNNGTTGTYRIIGIDGNLTRSRYVIDYYLVKI